MALTRASLCGSSNPASVYDERGIFSATYHFEIRADYFMYSYNSCIPIIGEQISL